ncbi:MAG: DUF1415 family protein [Rhodocyclaceae bacterium]|jgi:hypothetical protein|nr:DUF1415 domain-containing protein [Rhodocyclaceae bacterium]MCL4757579.1 DUF1415 family protein [Rhodocyclaceae bacterium]
MTDDEVLAAMRCWIEKAVIGLNLCPFAAPVYQRGQIRFVVSHARHADAFLEQLDEEINRIATSDADEIATTLLIHPHLFDEFDAFNELLGIAEEAVTEHELEGIVQVGGFHPRFRFEGTDEDDITNYSSRAPFATIHLLREESIEHALAAHPEAEHIAERNIETLRRLGKAGWDKLGIPFPTIEAVRG